MKCFIIATATTLAIALSGVSAHAGGWGGGWNGHNSNSHSSGLINVSPTVRTGSISLLNGTGVLNNSPIASGNVVSGILSGNKTGNGILGNNGLLNSVTLGVLGGNSQRYSVKGRR